MYAHSTVNSPRKVAGALVASAMTSGLFASAWLGLAPTANATCASFFGIGNSLDCTSTLFSAAIAIGDGAVAHADGFLGASFAVGTGATATTSGALTLASAVGNNVSAGANGLLGLALSVGGDDNEVAAGTSG